MNFNSEFDCYIQMLNYFNKINEKILNAESQYKLYENIMTDFNYVLSDEIINYNDANENIYTNKYMAEYGEIFKFLSKQIGNNINKNIYNFSNFINKYYNNISKENNKILNRKSNSISSDSYDELINEQYNNILNENSKILKNKSNIILNKKDDYNCKDSEKKQYNNMLKENIKVLENKPNIIQNKENSYSYDELINKYYNNISNKNNTNLKKQCDYEKYNIKKKNNIISLNSNNYNDLMNSYYHSKLKENNKNLKYNYNILQSEKGYYNIDNNEFSDNMKKNEYKENNNEKYDYMNFMLNDLYQCEKSNKEYNRYKIWGFKDKTNISANKDKYKNIINDNILYSKQKKNLFSDYKNLKYMDYKNEYNEKELQNNKNISFLSNIYNKNKRENLLNYIDNEKKLNESNSFENINSLLNYKNSNSSNYINLNNTQNELLENEFINNLYKDYFNHINSYEKNKKRAVNNYDKTSDNKYFSNIYNYKNYDMNSVLNRGYNYSLKDYLESINMTNTDNDDILISKNIFHENLKYLKDTADSEITNKFENKTISPQIQITFGNIEKAADVDEVLNILSERLQEQFEMSAEGLHI